jgi:hypothetical protein
MLGWYPPAFFMPIKDYLNAWWVSTSLLVSIKVFKMLSGFPPAFFMPIKAF